MQMYSRLHKAVQVSDIHWKTICIGALVYDDQYVSWRLDSTWVEKVAELFKLDGTGPNSFSAAIYPWGSATRRNMVPTVQYWVCEGAEWDK